MDKTFWLHWWPVLWNYNTEIKLFKKLIIGIEKVVSGVWHYKSSQMLEKSKVKQTSEGSLQGLDAMLLVAKQIRVHRNLDTSKTRAQRRAGAGVSKLK